MPQTIVLDSFPFTLDKNAVRERARLPPESDEARELEDLLERVSATARPRAVYRECFVEGRYEDGVTIEGRAFRSRFLRKVLDRVERVFAFVATCGSEPDRLARSEDDTLRRYWLDLIKTGLLDAVRAHLADHLERHFALGPSSTIGPGTGEAEVWPLVQQKELFALLGDLQAAIGVTLNASCLMIPNKTVSGLRFPSALSYRSCQLCRWKNCPSRAAEFDAKLWEETQA